MKKVLYFTATWCGPCKSFRPIVEQVIREGASISMVDVDMAPDLAQKVGITSVPSIVVVDDNYNVIKKHSGVMPKLQLENFIR